MTKCLRLRVAAAAPLGLKDEIAVPHVCARAAEHAFEFVEIPIPALDDEKQLPAHLQPVKAFQDQLFCDGKIALVGGD